MNTPLNLVDLTAFDHNVGDQYKIVTCIHFCLCERTTPKGTPNSFAFTSCVCKCAYQGTPDAAGAPRPRTARGLAEHEFNQDCARMKDFMHVNSFGYDFTARALVRCLQSGTLPCPMFPLLGIVEHMDELYKSVRRAVQHLHAVMCA